MEFLEKDGLTYADMLDCIRLGKAEILFARDGAVLLQDKTCGICALAADETACGRQALQALPDDFDGWIVAHGEKARRATYERFFIVDETKTTQVVYTKDSIVYPKRLRFCLPDLAQLQAIKEGYDRESPENIQAIYDKKELFAAVDEEGTFVGFIGFHPEGSMGLLYIFPEHRRKGYAEETESFLVEECLRRGKIPYGHVVYGNEASMRLQEKLGFVKAPQSVYWLRQRRKK